MICLLLLCCGCCIAAAAACINHCSSALDKFRNSFWSRQFRPLAAKDNTGNAADGASNLATAENTGKDASAADNKQVRTTTPSSDVAPLHYPDERPHYGRGNRYEPVDGDEDPHYGDEKPGYSDWPECRGTCDNGKCHLEKHYSGCCYLANANEKDDYPATDSEQAEVGNVVDSDEKTVALNAKRGMRVCW
jgi:hypothetical protein